MNSRIEATLMISAGAILAAGAQYAPSLGEKALSAMQLARAPITETTTEASPETAELAAWMSGITPGDGYRLALCQDAPQPRSSNNATINTRSDDGGFTVKISDGELVKVEADGVYTVEEDGDLIRILDGHGDVAFETNKSNPSIGSDVFTFRSHKFPGNLAFAPAAPAAPVSRAVLGIGSSELDAAMAAQLGVDLGVVIEFVEPGSGADAGGLQQYDVLVAIDGEPVDRRSLTTAIRSHEPGDTVSVEVIRKGERHTVDVELGAEQIAAPAINGIRFAPGDLGDLEELHRMLQSQMHELDSLIDGNLQIILPDAAPRPILTPRPPMFPDAAPAPEAGQHPDAVDASEMAPKTKTRRIPA